MVYDTNETARIGATTPNAGLTDSEQVRFDMADKILPSPEQLREFMSYDPLTGKLYWKHRNEKWFSTYRSFVTWNAKHAGREALISPDQKGYLKGSVLGVRVRAHRVAWAIYYGEWPDDQIDHKNLDVADNRISNLRQASQKQNSYNQRPKRSRSPLKGVTAVPDGKRKWRARIRVDGKEVSLGVFYTEEEAHLAYREAAAKHHGEFARVEYEQNYLEGPADEIQ